MSLRARLRLVVAFLTLMPACGGGGGGGGGTPSAPTAPAPTTPTTTMAPAPSANPPTVRVTADQTSGRSPLRVGFDACQSTDANGQKNLTFSVSYEGESLQSLGTSCGFSHNYSSPGVTEFGTRVCATDPTGAQGCQTVTITAYVPITLDVRTTASGCPVRIEAIATVGSGLRAFGAIDRMFFEARSTTGQRVTKEGSKMGSNQWTTGNWNTGFNTRVDVKATAYSGSVAGAEADSGRPGC